MRNLPERGTYQDRLEDLDLALDEDQGLLRWLLATLDRQADGVIDQLS